MGVASADRIAFEGRTHCVKEIAGPADARNLGAASGAALLRGKPGRARSRTIRRILAIDGRQDERQVRSYLRQYSLSECGTMLRPP
jgi:hypothetical protein